MSESAEQRFIGAAQQDITIIHIFCKTRLLSLNQREQCSICVNCGQKNSTLDFPTHDFVSGILTFDSFPNFWLVTRVFM